LRIHITTNQREVLVQELSDLRCREVFGQTREADDVGEHDADLALLGSDAALTSLVDQPAHERAWYVGREHAQAIDHRAECFRYLVQLPKQPSTDRWRWLEI
jgi:hypothetical protein